MKVVVSETAEAVSSRNNIGICSNNSNFFFSSSFHSSTYSNHGISNSSHRSISSPGYGYHRFVKGAIKPGMSLPVVPLQCLPSIILPRISIQANIARQSTTLHPPGTTPQRSGDGPPPSPLRQAPVSPDQHGQSMPSDARSTSFDDWAAFVQFSPLGELSTFRLSTAQIGVGNTSPCSYLESASIAQNDGVCGDGWIADIGASCRITSNNANMYFVQY